ncbi:AAA family ATPase [Longimicrobium sp.]|uniref:AAA family ATPase n=1 Tax=Longimicrobium sp. TaxID=2029185 RepID=UPI002ED97FB7
MIPRLREVRIGNYKSIEQAVVSLSGMTVLVGANGSGKSNFVDALAFVQECLSTSIEAAFRKRGGVTQVARHIRAGGREDLEFAFVIDLDPSTAAEYGFSIASDWNKTPEIIREYCTIREAGEEKHAFELERGRFTKRIPGIRPLVEPGRLMLYAASVTPEFQPVYSFLTGVRMYAIHPDDLREPRAPEPGLELESHGRNASSVVRVLTERFSDRHARIEGVLRSVVPGLEQVLVETIGSREFVMFVEATDRGPGAMLLDASTASDGTLRMLGMLLAVYQPATPTVLLVEEPEATIHPAAADVIVSVLMDAAKRSQVVITTHSPDVLDNKEITDDMLRVVSKPSGRTVITPISSASRTAVRQNLYSPGELLRMDELNPEIDPSHPSSAPEIDPAGTAG